MAKKYGIRTIYQLAQKICQLIVLFAPVIEKVVPADKKIYVDALNTACADFVLNIDVEAIYADEYPT